MALCETRRHVLRRLATLVVAGLLLTGCQRRPVVSWQPGAAESVLAVAGIERIAEPSIRVEGNQAVYRLPLPAARPRPNTALPRVAGGSVRLVADGIELLLPWRFAARAELAGGTARLIVTTVGTTRRETALDAGATLLTLEQARPDGPTRVFAVRLAADQAYRLRLCAAGRKMTARATVATMGANHTAAVNGGYFDPDDGPPLGALRLDGEWVSQPLLNRTCLLLEAGQRPRIDALAWQSELQTPLLKLPIEAVNHTPSDDAECAVTSEWWDGADAFRGMNRTMLGKLAIHHRATLDGTPTLVWRTDPAATSNVLGGGPRLLREGQVVVSEAVEAEQFRRDVRDSVTARSGVGLLPDGSIILAFGEGWAPYSRGFSLAEWAAVFHDLGCVEAMNLDGSRSATMVAGGRLQGRPSAGAPAEVANALVVTAP